MSQRTDNFKCTTCKLPPGSALPAKADCQGIELDPMSMLFIYLAFICLAGFAGGIGRSLSRNWDKKSFSKTSILSVVVSGVVGICGAFGIVFLSLSVNQLGLNGSFSIKGMIFIISSCVVAGFLCVEVFAKMTKPFEKQLKDMKESVNEDIEDMEESVQEKQKKAITASAKALVASNNAVKYATALSLSETAFARETNPEIENAVSAMEGIEEHFKNDRTLHIYLGRLYALNDDLIKAIELLRMFISNVGEKVNAPNTTLYKTHAAVAYFNIACYHSLLAKDTPKGLEQKRMLREANEALNMSTKLYPDYEKKSQTDTDLDFYRKNIKEICSATKNQTFFVLIFPEKSFFRKKVSSRLLFLFKILYVYVRIILKLLNWR